MKSELELMIESYMNKPIVPSTAERGAVLLKEEDLPYLDAGDGSALQMLHVDLNAGTWISKVRMKPGYRVIKHFHTGHVFGVTLQGKWFYAEYPDQVNEPGSYLFEPSGSVHTLCVPEDQTEDTVVWFAVHGANVNVDDEGKVVSITDARAALNVYRDFCRVTNQNTDKLLVIGE